MIDFLVDMLLGWFGLAMLPMRAVRLRLGTVLAADATTLAPALAANKVALIMAAFTPQENLIVADLTLATFDGSTALAGSTGAQQSGVNPISGQQLVTIKEPLGGWRWITTGLTNLPQTIYGAALIDDAGTTLLGVMVLNEPVPLSAVGQEVNLGTVSLTFVLQPLS